MVPEGGTGGGALATRPQGAYNTRAMFRRLFLSQAARRRTSWLIAAVLILPFIFFFHASIRTPAKGEGGTAGTLFGKSVPWEVFQREQRWIRFKLQTVAGQMPFDVLEPMVNQAAWERLMLLEEAKRRGLRVDDLELASAIQGFPDFQKDGRFVAERYHLFLRASGLTPQLFEEWLRGDLLMEKLRDAVRSEVTVTDEDVRAAFVRAHEQLAASVIVMEPGSFIDGAAKTVTEDDVRARYEARPDEVRRPEQVAFEYAGISRESLAGAVSLTDEDLQGHYEARQDEFLAADGTPKPFEEAREPVRQSLTSERVRKQLTERGLDLEEDLEAKRPFDEIATARGLTKQTAGPLNPRSPAPGGPDPALLQAVAELDEGNMSEVVRTTAGVYIARVTRRIPATVPPLEEVRDAIRERLIRERARGSARQAAEVVLAKLQARIAYGVRFEEAVLADGVSVTRARFGRTQPIDPLGYERAVNETAFAAPLGQLTPVLETARGFAVLRPEEYLPPDEAAFAQEEPALRSETLTRRQEERFGEWLQEVRGRAKLTSFVDGIADER